MSRYPSRNGIALPVQELGYEVVERQRGRTSNHHLHHTRESYQGKRHRQIFRGLVTNVQTMWIPEHVELHNRYSPPVMPSDFLMIDVVEEYLSLHGVIDVVCEQKTNEHYQVTQHQWDRIVGRNVRV